MSRLPRLWREEWDQHENASPKSVLWLSRRLFLMQTEFLELSSPDRVETSYTNEIARSYYSTSRREGSEPV
jgi:hypothetical protein